MLLTSSYPIVEPITLDEARLHLRLDADSSGHPDDTLVEGLISAAREWAEAFTGEVYAVTGYELRLDAFEDEITLPVTPARAVTAITYVDADGADQTLTQDAYQLSADPFDPILTAATTDGWPDGATDVRITFTAGYQPEADSSGLPFVRAIARAAMLLVIGHLYANREDTTTAALETIPMGAKSLLRPHRVRLGMA